MLQLPLIEYDEDKKGLIEPSRFHKNIGPPEHCVMPIYGALINKLKNDGKLEKVYELSTSLIPIEVYKIKYASRFVTVAHPGLGAPFAAAMLEELIALGCKKFVACGSAGVLKSELKGGAIVIPCSAVRDEGTSYHYAPPSRTIEMDKGIIKTLETVLLKHGIRYEIGKTWTTDAFYRETKGKIEKRKSEGCITVDMECSALIAVAKFRNVPFGQYLAVGDDVSGDEWDPRYHANKLHIQERIFWLSVEACINL